MGFLRKNWIAIVSLIIALIGGIPGILSVVNQIRERSILTFRLVNVITGVQMNEKTKEPNTMIFITGTASNEGSVAITPAYFELKGTLNEKRVEFKKQLIPSNVIFNSEEQNIFVEDPSRNDLQRYSSTITKGMPLHGHLMFLAPNVGVDELRSNFDRLKLSLICVDVLGKQHKAPIQLALHHGGGTVFPKHGVKILPKP